MINNLRVTITGADDKTSILDMFQLSRQYRFLEWGILCSTKREGQPRYPTVAWKAELFDANKDGDMFLAQHVCGDTAGSIMSGRSFGDGRYDRLQINGFSLEQATGLGPHTDREIILPFRDEASLARIVGYSAVHPKHRITGLFDVSGGRGAEPSSWKLPLGARCDVGLAGGIGPHNVIQTLHAIERDNPNLTDTWIDMETRVRDGDDALDMAKVEDVLAQVWGWMAERS